MMKNKFRLIVAAVAAVAISMVGCNNPAGDDGNQTPVTEHYTFGNLAQTAGSVTAVTIAANPGASPGTVINIRYDDSTEIPQTEGIFAVTFDVEAAPGWNAATGLSAGNLVVSNQTPVAGNFTFGNLAQTAGSVTAVTITANEGASPGAVVNVRYDGDTEIPQTEGTFAITFDVEAALGWNAATGLSAGNLVVNNQTPVVGHYTFGNLAQTAGSVTAVTITANEGASPGAIVNIRYNGNLEVPQMGGTFAVTFDVEAAPGWNAATGLSAGNLVVGVTNAGINWTAVQDNTFGIFPISAVPWGNDKFVAGSWGGGMAHSSDGISWTAVEDNVFDMIGGIAWGNNRFVAVGSYGRIAHSVDGNEWTVAENSAFKINDWISSIAWGNDRFIAVGYPWHGGGYSKMAHSTDGVNWTLVEETTFGTTHINTIAWSNGKFVAGGDDGRMAYSTNGVNWTTVENSTFGSSGIWSIAWGNNRFVAGGQNGRMAYSVDGINWTAVEDSTFGTSYIWTIAWGSSRFVAGGTDGKMAHSTDGINWTAVGDSTFGASEIWAIAWGNDRFVAVGQDGRIAVSICD